MRHEGAVDFSDATVKLYLKESNFKLITDNKKRQRIHHNAQVIKKRKVLRHRFEVLRMKDKFYLSMKHPRFQLLLLDKQDSDFAMEFICRLLPFFTLFDCFFMFG